MKHLNWKSAMAVFCLLALAVCAEPVARAQNEWGPWQSTGVGISISIARVNNTTLTWRFRNDTSKTLRSMEFDYSFVDADTNQQTTQHDILPLAIRPGGIFGGWTAYTANTRGSVSISITKYQFEN